LAIAIHFFPLPSVYTSSNLSASHPTRIDGRLGVSLLPWNFQEWLCSCRVWHVPTASHLKSDYRQKS
jgi:hypothetical protein